MKKEMTIDNKEIPNKITIEYLESIGLYLHIAPFPYAMQCITKSCAAWPDVGKDREIDHKPADVFEWSKDVYSGVVWKAEVLFQYSIDNKWGIKVVGGDGMGHKQFDTYREAFEYCSKFIEAEFKQVLNGTNKSIKIHHRCWTSNGRKIQGNGTSK